MLNSGKSVLFNLLDPSMLWKDLKESPSTVVNFSQFIDIMEYK